MYTFVDNIKTILTYTEDIAFVVGIVVTVSLISLILNIAQTFQIKEMKKEIESIKNFLFYKN